MADEKEKAQDKKRQQQNNEENEEPTGYGKSGGHMGAGKSGGENMGTEKPSDHKSMGSHKPDEEAEK